MKILCCCLLLLLGMSTAAQKKVPARLRFAPHQLGVSINPLPLLNPDQRLLLGVERRLRPNWAVLADAGPVLHSTFFSNAQHSYGFELRPALRYYFGRHLDGYVQGQLQYRLVRYRMHDWLGKNCVNGVPAYDRLQDFTYQKQNIGPALVVGGLERLGKHWLLDVSAGLGLLYRTQKVSSEPNACYFPETIFGVAQQRSNFWVPVLPLAVKLVYVVR